MKTSRTPRQSPRRERRLEESRDSYRDSAKLPDPGRCPACGATYVKGRWTWREAPADAARYICPACQRTRDRLPAGYVTLEGPFLPAHRAEILNLVRAREARDREEHPLQRIIAVESTADRIVVTTTDAHLARGIASAVHEAFKGTLDISQAQGENPLRATWKR
jgi:hypothetical protein